MPLSIVRNDITKMNVDAIVNAANESLLGGGGVDGCIHRAAGPKLLAECRTLGGCETGQAKITGAGDLLCKYVIHAVGPVWYGGNDGERELLVSCYEKSLLLAWEHHCETVAFPLISSGVYGYPKDKALRVAVDTVAAFLSDHEMTVYLVIFDRASYDIGGKLFSDIAEYIDDRYAEEHADARSVRMTRAENAPAKHTVRGLFSPKKNAPSVREDRVSEDTAPDSYAMPLCNALPQSLDEALAQIDESFSEMLLRKIDERGMTDVACYKKANIDRKLFSKVRCDRLYRPSKQTALAFAVALELSLDETRELLSKAGYALSHSSKFDIIIEYFIAHGNYNVFEINEALFAFDQCLLGA